MTIKSYTDAMTGQRRWAVRSLGGRLLRSFDSRASAKQWVQEVN